MTQFYSENIHFSKVQSKLNALNERGKIIKWDLKPIGACNFLLTVEYK